MIIDDDRAPDMMETVDNVAAVWESDDSVLYDPKFCFPPETLLALARCPDLMYRERRRHVDSDDAIAYVFGLGGLAVGDSISGGCATTTTAESSGTGVDEYSELDQEPAAYAAAVEPEEPHYVLVGTSEEVERERRREADAEAMFVDAWNNQVRSIEQLLEEIDEEASRTAARNNDGLVVRDADKFFDGFLEEEAAIEVGWKKGRSMN